MIGRFELNSKYKIPAACVIAGCILVVSIVIILPRENLTFSWSVAIGDEFEFNVSAYGMIEDPPGYLVESIELSIIANTTIVVTIDSLPSIDIKSEEKFLDAVFENKVSTRFSNGSDIPTNISSALNGLVSRFFMPVGNWNFLDSLFPDSPEDAGQLEFGCNTYLSQLNNDSFFFGHRYYNVDAGSWWHGYISCSNGVPHVIVTASSSYHPSYVFYSWTFRLDLISD